MPLHRTSAHGGDQPPARSDSAPTALLEGVVALVDDALSAGEDDIAVAAAAFAFELADAVSPCAHSFARFDKATGLLWCPSCCAGFGAAS